MTAPTTVDDRDTVARMISAMMEGIYGEDDPVVMVLAWMHRSAPKQVKIVSNILERDTRHELLAAAMAVVKTDKGDPPIDVSRGNG